MSVTYLVDDVHQAWIDFSVGDGLVDLGGDKNDGLVPLVNRRSKVQNVDINWQSR